MSFRSTTLSFLTATVLVAAFGCSKGTEPLAHSQGQPASQGQAAGGPGGAPADVVSGHAPEAGATGDRQLPQGHPPVGPPGQIAPAPPGSGTGATGLVWSVPASWKEEAPANPMRRAQFRAPKAAGDPEDGECAVFYFGPNQGGNPEDNALRWVDQFKQPDGSSSQGKAKISKKTVGGREVMFVEVKGTYAGMAMMPGMGMAPEKPGYALLGAIVPGPDAPWFFKFTGPQKTIDANRAAFDSLIASLKPGS